MKTKELIVEALTEIGIFINDIGEDCDLRDYIIDSIQFITAIIQIEQKLDIELPDEFLLYDNFSSLNALGNIISSYIENI